VSSKVGHLQVGESLSCRYNLLCKTKRSLFVWLKYLKIDTIIKKFKRYKAIVNILDNKNKMWYNKVERKFYISDILI